MSWSYNIICYCSPIQCIFTCTGRPSSIHYVISHSSTVPYTYQSSHEFFKKITPRLLAWSRVESCRCTSSPCPVVVKFPGWCPLYIQIASTPTDFCLNVWSLFYLQAIEAVLTSDSLQRKDSRERTAVYLIEVPSNSLFCREETALQGKLDKLAGQIGQLGLAAAAFALISMAGQFTYTEFIAGSSSWDWEYLSTYLHFLITAITIVVSLKHLQLLSTGDDSLSWDVWSFLSFMIEVFRYRSLGWVIAITDWSKSMQRHLPSAEFS